jgi:outer membrane receptor protein involved in Fe transport
VVCNVTLTNPGLYPGCAPLNPFGPTSESAAALSYITDFTQSWATTTLDEAWGSITGSPFSTWAGPTNMALSGEWRKTSFKSTSQVPPTDLQDCTGLRYNCSASSPIHAVTFRNAPLVSQQVKEIAIEADAPLLKDAPLARSLNLNLAARYADYDTTKGGAVTWKVGLDWHLNDELTVRATRSRDFRAPNLNDLYAPATISRSNVVDQLTGQTLLAAPSSGGGNPNLKPEVGDTLTAGFVYQARWLPGSSLSVDAYDIKITNAIAGVNGVNVTVQQLCNASGGPSPYCALISRPFPLSNTTPANNATLFYNTSINAAYVKSWGLDMEGNYATRLFERPLLLRALVTWQPENRQVTPGLSDLDSAGATTPEWRLTGFINYNVTDRFKVGITQRWRSAVWWNADRTIVYAMSPVPSFGWTNLNLTYVPPVDRVHTEIYLNITNLFNQISPRYTTSTANPGVIGAYFPTDDFVGRYFTLGVRIQL